MPLELAAALHDLKLPENALLAVPVTVLYDRGQTVMPSTLLHQRIPQPYVLLNPADAAGELGIANGAAVQVSLNGTSTLATARLDELGAAGRGAGAAQPGDSHQLVQQPVEIRMVERVVA